METQNKKMIQDAYKERIVTGGVYAIKNTTNDKNLLLSTNDLQGSKNRFDFSKKTGSCVNLKLQADWDEFGADAFIFDTLDILEKTVAQTQKEFSDDLKLLLEIWLGKTAPEKLY